jgi:predicted lipase
MKIALFLIFLIFIFIVFSFNSNGNKKLKTYNFTSFLNSNNQINPTPTKSNFLKLKSLIWLVYNFSPDSKMNNPIIQEHIDNKSTQIATDFINKSGLDKITLIEGQENFFGRYYTSIFGVIGIDKNNTDTAILAFRGTTTKSDWLADVFANFNELNQIIDGIDKNIKVAHGFGSLFGIFKGLTNVTMDKQIDNWLNLNNIKNIIITGHSLGGALATLSAVYIKSKYPVLNVTLYTYASPRVGNTEFYNYYKKLGLDKSSFRFFSSYDIVPKMPPETIFGYKHVGIDYELKDIKPSLCSKVSDVLYYHLYTFYDFDKDCTSQTDKWLELINN